MQLIFPDDADEAGRILVEQCGQNLPFLQDQDERGLERVRFAALKISSGDLKRLQHAIDVAQRDWRDELIWAGFAEHVDTHAHWAAKNTWRTMRLPAHQYLDELGIAYEARNFPPETEKGAAAVARVLGFPERQAVKTLIFQVDTGERVLVMLGGDQSAVSGNLKKAIGSRNIRMAAPEAVKETTGYVIGSIPPFGWQPAGFRSFLERSLLAEPLLGVGAGQWGNEIMITPQDLVRATRAIVVNLTEAGEPVT